MRNTSIRGLQIKDGAIGATQLDVAVNASLALADTAIQTELDPVFGAAEAALFVAGDKALLDSALQTELDPVFGASEAALFVAGDKALLDSALQTELDPVFGAAEAALFVAGDKALLDSALQEVVAGDVKPTVGDVGKYLKATAENVASWVDVSVEGILETDITSEVTTVGSGGEDTFVIAVDCVAASICVYLNGLLLEKGEGKDYTYTSGTKTVLLAVAADEDDIVTINYIKKSAV